MNEEPHFLATSGERLFAFLHRPEAPCRGGIVLCSPLAEEKLWAHRVFVSFARELATQGYAVLRFDYRGEGDSDRAFEQSDLNTRVEDVATAIEALKRLVPGVQVVTLLGLRLGASIAALAADGRQDIDRLVLWDPATSGTDYMQTLLRSNLAAQMAIHGKVIEGRELLTQRLERGETVNIEGYELAEPLFRQVSALNLPDLLTRSTVATQIVSITPRPAAPRPALSELVARCPNARLDCAVEEPFWKEIKVFYQRADDLFAVTTSWLGARP